MELMEIIGDALVYPFHNLKALGLYLILGIIFGIAVIGTSAAIVAGDSMKNVLATIGSGIIGIVIALIISFVINGYVLDVVKYGINRDRGAPGIDFVRQFINGFKLCIVQIVYFIIPIIIAAILAIIFQQWLTIIIDIILFIVFALAAFMAECRLAKTEDIGYALAIGEAIEDISKVGVLKLLGFIVLVFIIAFILLLIAGAINRWNPYVGGVILGIVGIYLVFFEARATGLLYSQV